MDDEEDFTPAEAEYFRTGGKADPFAQPGGTEPGGDASTGAGGAGGAGGGDSDGAGGGEGKGSPQAKAQEEAEPGEVELDPEGRVRDAKTGRYVPVTALQRERQEKKAIREERDTLKTRWEELSTKLTRILEVGSQPQGQAAPAKKEPPKLIDPREDFIGALEQERQARLALEQELQGTKTQTSQALEQQRQAQLFQADLQAFVQKTPDFSDAFVHLTDARSKQLSRLAAFRTPEGKPDEAKIRAHVQQEAQEIIANAVRLQQSPAQELYEWAQSYGYAPKKADTAKDQPTDKARETVETIAAGKQGARTLGNSGGGASQGLTMDAFLEMDDAVVASKMQADPAFAAEVRRLLGAR